MVNIINKISITPTLKDELKLFDLVEISLIKRSYYFLPSFVKASSVALS